jgi:hypothetical protein
MNVVIGVDPHKASHTAVAIDEAEDEVSSVKVRATHRQVEQLVRWAEPFEKRRWAIESAGGMGYLLAQQLVARGEEVLDVPAADVHKRRDSGGSQVIPVCEHDDRPLLDAEAGYGREYFGTKFRSLKGLWLRCKRFS